MKYEVVIIFASLPEQLFSIFFVAMEETHYVSQITFVTSNTAKLPMLQGLCLKRVNLRKGCHETYNETALRRMRNNDLLNWAGSIVKPY